MTNLQRRALRIAILVCLLACVRSQDLLGQALNITTPSPLPDAIVGTPYSLTFAATGGVGPRIWTLDSAPNTLPPGLTGPSAAGVLSGTPTTAGTFTFRIRVETLTDNDEMNFTLRISNPVSITTGSPLPPAIQGTAYSQSLAATGGVTPYSWTLVTAGTLPTGLTLSSAGAITGTPTGSGTSNFTVRLSDASNPAQTLEKAMTLTVFAITTVSPLTPGTTGTAYSQTLSTAGGTAPVSWTMVSPTQLPAGLTLSTAGVISGTPTAAGTTNFTVRATDSSTPALIVQKAFSLNIALALSITTATPLPSGTPGVSYPPQTLTAVGGTAPYTWAITAGTLPPGLTRTGATISGTPSSAGSSTFTVQVSDSSSPVRTAEKVFTLDIVLPLIISTATPLPAGAVGTAYSQSFNAAGGVGPYSWAVTLGTLPAGLTLSPLGALTGTPSASGTSNFTIRVMDSTNPPQNFSKAFALTIKALLAITTTSVPVGAVGSSYSTQLAASGDPPITWSLASGTLPQGITLSATGLLSGTPTSSGTFDFIVRVNSDGPPQTSTRSFQIVVNSALTLTTTTVPSGTGFVPYTTTLNATGGIPPLSWTLAGGNLPTGLSLSSAGVISGTPTALGTASFTVRVADSAGASALRGFSISIVQGNLTITTTSLPGGVQGFPYSSAFQAVGGPTPLTWTLVSGTLPPGFSMTPGGVVQGTTTSPFTRSIRVRVTDSSGAFDERDFSLAIGPALGTVSLSGLQSTVLPMQQLPITVSLASAYPAELQGTLTLSFVSTAVLPVNDPAVQFSTGGRTVNFTIPANTTTAVFPSSLQLVTGTVAGGIVITGNIQNGPSGLTLSSTSVSSTPPQMTNIVATRIPGGLRVRVTGFSPERRVTEVEFSFEFRVSGAIQLVNLTRTVITDFNAWYETAASAPFGSAFQFEQFFSVEGDTAFIEAVRITLRNVQGSTQSARTPFTGS